jgi:hypothetical protein
MSIDPKTLAIDTAIWDLFTRDADGYTIYLGRGTHAELAVHNKTCEANGYSSSRLALDPNAPVDWGQIIVLRPPYYDIEKCVVVRERHDPEAKD